MKCYCVPTITAGSPSRLPVFCLSEAVLGSQHECQWAIESEDERNSTVEEQAKLSVQNDDVRGAEVEDEEDKLYSDYE